MSSIKCQRLNARCQLVAALKTFLTSSAMGPSTGARSTTEMLTQDLGDTKSFIESKNFISLSRRGRLDNKMRFFDSMNFFLKKKKCICEEGDLYNPNEHNNLFISCQHVELLK